MKGVSIVKDFFRDDIDPNTAFSQVTSYAMSDLDMGKSPVRAALDSATEIALPVLVATIATKHNCAPACTERFPSSCPVKTPPRTEDEVRNSRPADSPAANPLQFQSTVCLRSYRGDRPKRGLQHPRERLPLLGIILFCIRCIRGEGLHGFVLPATFNLVLLHFTVQRGWFDIQLSGCTVFAVDLSMTPRQCAEDRLAFDLSPGLFARFRLLGFDSGGIV